MKPFIHLIKKTCGLLHFIISVCQFFIRLHWRIEFFFSYKKCFINNDKLCNDTTKQSCISMKKQCIFLIRDCFFGIYCWCLMSRAQMWWQLNKCLTFFFIVYYFIFIQFLLYFIVISHRNLCLGSEWGKERKN